MTLLKAKENATLSKGVLYVYTQLVRVLSDAYPKTPTIPVFATIRYGSARNIRGALLETCSKSPSVSSDLKNASLA